MTLAILGSIAGVFCPDINQAVHQASGLHPEGPHVLSAWGCVWLLARWLLATLSTGEDISHS